MVVSELLTIGRPASLTVPELNQSSRAINGLDVAIGLLQIVEISGGSIADVLPLPVTESIYEPAFI